LYLGRTIGAVFGQHKAIGMLRGTAEERESILAFSKSIYRKTEPVALHLHI